MALNRVRLAATQYVATSAGSIYSNPASTKTLVTGVLLFNDHTSSLTVTVYNVPDSGGSVGTAAAGDKVAEVALVPKESLWLGFGEPGIMLIDTNDSIQAVTSSSSKVTVTVQGDTIT